MTRPQINFSEVATEQVLSPGAYIFNIDDIEYSATDRFEGLVLKLTTLGAVKRLPSGETEIDTAVPEVGMKVTDFKGFANPTALGHFLKLLLALGYTREEVQTMYDQGVEGFTNISDFVGTQIVYRVSKTTNKGGDPRNYFNDPRRATDEELVPVES